MRSGFSGSAANLARALRADPYFAVHGAALEEGLPNLLSEVTNRIGHQVRLTNQTSHHARAVRGNEECIRNAK